MADGGRKITKVQIYHCGFCKNNLRHILYGMPSKSMRFPAFVALIEHSVLGRFLFDTGYSPAVFENGMISRLYHLLNPIILKPHDIITQRLRADHIRPDSIRGIIISHPHPDHIGAVRLFPQSKIIVSNDVWEEMTGQRRKSLLTFKNLLPQNRDHYIVAEEKISDHFLCRYFDSVIDIFGDRSIVGVILGGHTKGQMGVYLEDFELFLTADASWRETLLTETGRMKPIVRKIQNNFKEYERTVKSLLSLKRDFPNIRLIFSHDNSEERVYE